MQHDELIERHDVLIARLREKRDDIHELLYEAADALQSQAAEIARYKELLGRNKQGWENAIELGLLPVQHRQTAHDLMEETCAALSGDER